ncbi:extensin-like [Helianthus annuus]|uniref:extensin-like n=1 Tax=Helianthus annuus TaxID=4232 RepID=UPI000B906377|nr:extensin-like [Helianthus annuus]
MGGPSNVVPEIDITPATFAPPPHPMGFENPILTYPDTTRYNPFEPQAPTCYNYQPPAYDPYKAVNYNALYPSPFPPAYLTGYPAYGYQYPSSQSLPQPQPPPQQQQPPQPQQLEISQRVQNTERKVERGEEKTHKFLKGLAKFIKGKKNDD